MRCKKHYTDLTSIVGVCACCLRERLLSVIAAQQQLEAQSQLQAQNPDGKHNNYSPYVHNRRRNQSEGAAVLSENIRRNDQPHHRHTVSEQLFYKTPEIRPDSTPGVESKKKRSFLRFLSFRYIFRSRNRKSVNSVSEPPVRRQYCRDRGMSPVRNSDVGDVDEDESNNATSEYESTGSWKNTPRRTPARGGGGHRRNLSGFKYCLSPLVRASPNRQWNQKGLPTDSVISAEIRAPVKPHLSVTKTYCANRSRKIADFGRSNQTR